MRDAISEIVGQGGLSDGGSAQIYRALRSLLCSACGAMIAKDTLFTRCSVKGVGLSIMPQCRKCTPFVFQPDKQEKSALLQELLRENAPASSSRESALADASRDTSAQEKRHVAEEVRKRLGPALKKGRHQPK
jgi:hypothetical protein